MAETNKEIKARLNESSYGLKQRLEGSGKVKMPGLCRSCAKMRYRDSLYGATEAFCRAFDQKLNPEDPIVVCTEYWPKGHPELETMIEHSTLITVKHYDNEGLYL